MLVGAVSCTAFVLSHGRGWQEDNQCQSSLTWQVSCTASALSHRMGRQEDIWWQGLSSGAVGCTPFVLRHRMGRPVGHPIPVLAYRGWAVLHVHDAIGWA